MKTSDPGAGVRSRAGRAARGATDLAASSRESWRELVGGRLRDKPWFWDALIVGTLALWILLTTAGLGSPLILLGLAMIVPLYWRRREPLIVALVVAAACLVQVFLTNEPHPGNIAVPIAVYSAAVFGTRKESRAVLALGLVGAVVAGADWAFSYVGGLSQLIFSFAFGSLFMAMFVGVAWVLGDVVRRRKAVVARLQEQNRALARDQAQRAKLAAQDERAAIAREMHDVVAHSLAVVVVQADGALYAARTALDAPPGISADRAALERAAATLQTLADTARTSLAETRKLVGVLREEGAGAEYSPLQGLAHLDDLVQRVRDSGMTVELAVQGAVDDLPRDVDLAAYRVIQESLTNALKHAGPDATVKVDVLRTPAVLLVRVIDDGQGLAPDADGEGNGILGMAERVEVLGGSVHAGPRSRAPGWEVAATIPVQEPSDTQTPPAGTEGRSGATLGRA